MLIIAFIMIPITFLIISFIVLASREAQVQAVCVDPLIGLVRRPDVAAHLGEGGRPIPLTLSSTIRAGRPPVVVAEEAEDQADELHLLLRFNGHQLGTLLGEAEGSSIVPVHVVVSVEEKAPHASQGAVHPRTLARAFLSSWQRIAKCEDPSKQ